MDSLSFSIEINASPYLQVDNYFTLIVQNINNVHIQQLNGRQASSPKFRYLLHISLSSSDNREKRVIPIRGHCRSSISASKGKSVRLLLRPRSQNTSAASRSKFFGIFMFLHLSLLHTFSTCFGRMRPSTGSM